LGYYGNFFDTVDQPLVSTGTAQIVAINSDAGSVGFSLTGTGTVVIANPGTYTMIYSIQLKNTANDIHYADIWFRFNGSDYPDSTTRFHIPARKNASEFGYAVATVNFVVTSINPGDTVELWWHADSTNVSIEYLPPGVAPVHPATPSVIATFTQVMYTQVGPTGPTGPAGLGGVNISIASGVAPPAEGGMTSTGRTYTDSSGTYDIYQFNAQTGLMSGTNVYVIYLGTIYDPNDTLTFRKITAKSIVRAIDPVFQECQTALGSGALVLDTVAGNVAPVAFMTINVDNTVSTDFYDIFLITANTNAFDAYVDVEFEFIIANTTTPIFTN
jgi:hypothetical protein